MAEKKLISLATPKALRKQLGVKLGQNMPAKKLVAAVKRPGKLGRRGLLVENLNRIGK